MILSLHGVVVGGRAGWPEVAEVAKKAGYPGVELPVPKAMERGAEAALGVLKNNGLKPGVVGFPVDLRKDDATFEKGMAELGPTAAFAAAIGCPRMATYIMSSAELPKAEQRKLLHGRLSRAAKVLAEHKVRLGLEFLGPLHIRKAMPYEFIWKMGEMLEFARECGPNVGLLLDSWHWHHAGATPADILKAGREAIVHVHISDAPSLPPEQIKDNERLLPGEGIIDFAGFFGALKKIGYNGAVSPEVFGRGLQKMPLAEAAQLTHDSSVAVMKKYGVA